MRFMMMVKAPETGPPSPELIAAVGKLSQEMAEAGVLLDTGGLAPSARGARIRLSGAKLTVIDGPFTESKELVGGFAVLRAASKAEAIELGRRLMQESPKFIATLTRLVRDLAAAEDLAHDALVAALEQWPREGIPRKPGAWLVAAAKHRAIDLLRRRTRLDRKHHAYSGAT